MDKHNIDQFFKNCIQDLEKIGIPISKNINPHVKVTKAFSYAGKCSSRPKRYTKDGKVYYRRVFQISIADYIFEDEELTKNVIYHELLHTCPGCQNHGDNFKILMHEVNDLLHANIKILLDKDDYKNTSREEKYKERAKYEVCCENCGTLKYLQRKTAVVKDAEHYHCTRCKGRIYIKECS